MDALLPLSWKFEALQTLPEGEPYEKDALVLAASLAALSQHPAAEDLRRVAGRQGVAAAPVTGFKDFGERGFGGLVQLPGEAAPRAALMGDMSFLKTSDLETPEVLEAAGRRYEEGGARVLMIGWDGHVYGAVSFRPAPRAGNL
jgi:cation transport ATPase